MGAVVPSRDDNIEVIVLNGPSSAGKTTIASALQEVLEVSWLVFGIDTLIGALGLPLLEMHDDAIIGARPRQHVVREGGIKFDVDGEITVGAEFRRLEAAWLEGLSRMAESGARLILDEVFLDGVHSQDRFRRAFDGRSIMWVGVTCDVDVATQRERDRGDRVVGASEKQSRHVHEGVHYDLVVDTTSRTPDDVAQQIAEHLRALRA
jgi:chloramphenicol 3-O phosphotransferase